MDLVYVGVVAVFFAASFGMAWLIGANDTPGGASR